MLALQDIDLPPADEAFRTEVREFLAHELDPATREAANASESFLISFAERDIALPWQAKLRARGWLAPKLPPSMGGPGWGPLQHFIFETEAGLAGAPFLPGFGLDYLAPVLVKFGTPEQRLQLIPRILDGKDYWCQGFSEPGAGSDLAAVQCAATRVGDEYVVNGSKLWTTQAHLADHIFCLVRTEKLDKPQRGISFLLIDMRSPGVSVRPIRLIGGDFDVNQVFFDDTRVPAANLVGALGDGWRIAKYLLELERGGFVVSGHVERRLRWLKDLLRNEAGHATIPENNEFRQRLNELDLAVLAYSHLELKAMVEPEVGMLRDSQVSIIKILYCDLHQRIDDLAFDIMGPTGRYMRRERPLRSVGDPVGGRDYLEPIVPRLLNDHALSILGGSHEVQRNLIARSLLS